MGVTNAESKTTLSGSITPPLEKVVNAISENGKTKKWEKSIKNRQHAIAGFTAGFVSSTLCYPLELIKTRKQSNHYKSYSGTFKAVIDTVQTRGIRNLYRGIMPGWIGSAGAWGMYMGIYNNLKMRMREYPGQKLGKLEHLSASLAGGVVVQLSINPIWVVKANLQLETYNTTGQAVGHLWKTEGIRGFYRGIVPGLWLCFQGAIQFMIYEELRYMTSEHFNQDVETQSVPWWATVCNTVIAKSIADTSLYPLQTIRTKIRHVHETKYTGIVDATRQVFQNQGARGFYRGLGTNLMRIMPAQCITFLTYEQMKAYFGSQKRVKD